MKLSYIVSIFVVAALVDLSVQWRGNVCSRTVCSYRRIRVCAYRFWGSCCSWKWIWEPNYYTQYYCCPGWTTSSYQNCDRAICIPSCKNSGTCVRPNVCRCPDGAIGSRCNTLVCNYQRPCFPGDCQASTGSNPTCTCDPGFQHLTSNKNDWCRELEVDQKPEIYEVSARFSFYERGTGGQAMEKYSLYVDSTMSDDVDILWTNRFMFNWLNVTASGHYMPPDNYTPPNFIEDYTIGIGRAEVHFLQEKIPFSGSGASEVTLDITRPCSPDVSNLNPALDTYYCAISNQTITTSMENGDTVTITFRVESGGYRKLQEIGVNQASKGTQLFEGRLEEKAMAYKFDFKKPEHHCLQSNCTINQTMFYMDEDITKESVTLRWSDWTDTLSGMYRYAWEVFELKVDGNLVLREPDPLGPIHGPVEVNQSSSSSNSFSAIYNPPHAGVYSFILEASDRANNSVFIRRIVLYDTTSEVSTDNDPDRRLYVSSANPVGDYTWQQDPTADIEVTWAEHFVNLVHENGKWLNSVLRYPKELEDNIKDIPRDSNKDDHDGHRTVNEIANKRGIVKFEVAKAKDSSNGDNQPLVPNESEWIDVFLNDSYTRNGASWSLSSKDTVTVWVRATDAMGNKKVGRTQVRFDNSPPEVGSNITFQRNVQSHGVPFSSSVQLTALDMQSGMKRIDVFVFETGNNNLVNNFTMPIPTIPKCDNSADGCYCTPAHACFNKQQVLSISNCRLWVAKDLGESQSVNIRMDFRNMAGLTNSQSIRVDNVGLLNGTRTYIGPMNLKTTAVGETTATVTWEHSNSCYTRTELWINYEINGQPVMEKLHHSATSYNLAGLSPGTKYTIMLISQYGDVKSDPVPIVIETKGGGPTAGAVAGIVIGSLLFLVIILIVIGLVLFKLGLLAGLMSRRRNYRETTREEGRIVHQTTAMQNNRASRWAFENTTYNKDEEIYMYGSMDLGEPWYVPSDDLTLISEINTGRFAKIYKAKWRETPKNVREVAAKVLKARESEDQILLMLAKINFAATQVGEHRNIVGFLGAVMENDALGPVMVLEYCETGQLDKWLVKKRSNVSEDVLDRIQNFSLEIARAMEYLANKGIVHRKLAARNCLLTFLLEVKVTGFGPCQNDEAQDDGKGDRIPIKWTAPECFKTLKNANEKSDVWSYGVTLWEIFSMGESPYSNIRGRDLPTKVKGGHRLTRPEYAEDLHYRLMQDCWEDSPASRPVFRNIVDNLEHSFGLRPGDDQNYYYQR